MKNFKKIALGLLVGALAIGFSSFTNAHTHKKGAAQINYYYNIDGNATDHSVSNFVYDENGSCESSTSSCKAQWSTTNAPIQGDSPSASLAPSYVGNALTGTYQPGN